METINAIKEELEKIQDESYCVEKFEKKKEFEIIHASLNELKMLARMNSMI